MFRRLLRVVLLILEVSLCTAGVSGCSKHEIDANATGALAGTSNRLPTLPRAARDSSGPVYADRMAPTPQQTRAVEGTGEFIRPTAHALASAGSTRSGPITLNLANVSVPQAAKAVLGDVFHVNYVVDDRIKGTVSLETAAPVDSRTLAHMFEAALRGAGAMLLQDGNSFRIVAADPAVGVGAIVTGRSEPPTSVQFGQRAQVIQLKYVSAREMERVLRPMLRRESVVNSDPTRNVITVTGPSQEISIALDAVGVFDVDWMKGMSFALVPLTSSDPDAVASELDTVFFNDKSGPSKGVVRFVPNRRLNAILVITSQPNYLSLAETWVRRLDGASRDGEEQLFVYHIQNRPAGELAQVLRRVFAGADSNSAAAPQQSPTSPKFTPGIAAAVPASMSASGLPGRVGDALPTRSSEPAPQQVEEDTPQVARDQSANTGPRIKVVADEANNALFITARPVDYKKVLKVLERADLNPNQVLLEATIFEVSLNDKLQFGLRWHVEKGAHSNTFSDLASGAVTAAFPGFSYFFAAKDIQVALNALSTVTTVKVISSPSLMVLDNKTALLQVGDRVPITTQSAVSVLTPGAPVVNSVQYQDTGVILSVTPRVADNGRVTLTIEQEVSDVSKTTSSGIDSPTIQQRKIKTTVAVNDGEGLALGGLIQDRKGLDKTQIPVLGDIPILGNAFKDKTNTIERTELLIIITPRVVRDATEARFVTDEFRQRLDVPGFPRERRPPGIHENFERVLR